MEIILFFQRFANPFWDRFFQIVTMLGEESFYIIILSIIFWCVDKRSGYKMAFALLLSGVLNGVLKSVVRAPRPIGSEGIRSLRVETASGTSFPSGHTQSATAFLGAVMKRLRRAWAWAIGCLLILLVGLSRLYLGVHWPIDVLGGIAMGAIAVVLADFVFEWAMRRGSHWLALVLLAPTVAAALVWRTNADLVKTAATFCGFLIGHSMESRFIRFDPKAPFWKQAAKCALGLAVALALKEGLKPLLPQTHGFDFLRYLILGLWITVGAPVAFAALRLGGAPQRPVHPSNP